MDYRTSWRRVRDFFGALLCTFASIRSLTPSAKQSTGLFSSADCVCSLLVRIPLFVLPKQKAGLATCFSFWRRVRDFFGALPCTFASLRSLTPSAKTVHRTVFFRRLRLLPPCSNPSFVLPKQKAGLATCFSFWRRVRDFFGALLCTFASLRSLTPSAKTVHRTVFFRRQVCSLLVRTLFLFCQSKKQALRPAFHFGGELGIRTLGTLRTQHFEFYGLMEV